MWPDERFEDEDLDPERPGCWSQEFISLLTLNEMAHGTFNKWERDQDYWLVFGIERFNSDS